MQRFDQAEEVIIDSGLLRVRRAGKHVQLTVTEFKLLRALTDNAGRALPRDQLLDAIDPTMKREVYYRAVDSNIKRLRCKLKPIGLAGCVKTLRGVGYYWETSSCTIPATG